MDDRIDMSGHESTGALLRTIRLERSLEISDVAQETRITPDIIRAMEADDYSSLPALAFARGFYGLYATTLGLDPEKIVQRFLEEYRKAEAAPKASGLNPPQWQGRSVGSMASPPSHSFGTYLGIGLLLLLAVLAALSWYTGYNPASQASKWLRGFQDPPAQQSPPADQAQQPAAQGQSQVSPPPSISSEPAAPIPEPLPPPETQQPVADGYRYLLVVEFIDTTSMSITVDENPPETVTLAGGTIKTWQASESITLEMPPAAAVRLFLNGIALPLPPASDGTISLTIPEYLLD